MYSPKFVLVKDHTEIAIALSPRSNTMHMHMSWALIQIKKITGRGRMPNGSGGTSNGSRKPARGSRVCDKIAAEITAGRKFYSLEFFPPSTVNGARNLVARVDRLAQQNPSPLFVDVTWTLSSGKRALETLIGAKAVCAVDVQMHLTCTDLTEDMCEGVLEDAAQAGIWSVLALRGDPSPGTTQWRKADGGFAHAGELVSFIRKKYGDAFSIAVAGHPQGHPCSSSRDQSIQHLKDKVNAGADYIITQILFEADEYAKFVSDCRTAGITCPIVPGVLLIPASLQQFEAICAHCQVKPPEALLAELQAAAASGDEEDVRLVGVRHCKSLCDALLKGGAPGVYLYTMNLEKSASEVIKSVGMP
jgi:methylenetetrahydrofolate reductase (NADPH)